MHKQLATQTQNQNHSDTYGLVLHVQALNQYKFIFSIDESNLNQVSTLLISDFEILNRRGWPSVIGINTLNLSDLQTLSEFSSSVFLNAIETSQTDVAFEWKLVDQALLLGFRVFYDANSKRTYINGAEPIDFCEYIVSDNSRLEKFPRYSATASSAGVLRNQNVIIVFDLLQDFEVLKPIVQSLANVVRAGLVVAFVTPRVNKSPVWSLLGPFLAAMGVQVYFPNNSLEAAALLPASGVLITASESSASNHRFSHELCQLANPNLLKCTFQHGYENIGLQHHIAHNMAYRDGIRFSSDVIFTWADADQLVDCHPKDKMKIVPIGVTKAIAQDAVDARQNLLTGVLAWDVDEGIFEENQTRTANILLCENLHSVRFKDPKLSDGFKNMMLSLQNSPYANLRVRSHPGKKLLESDSRYSSFKFIGGELTCASIVKFDFLLSPPSTIILDAVLCGVSAVVWSATEKFGDLENYKTIPSFEKAEDLIEMLVVNEQEKLETVFMNLRWAAKNTVAFDGSRYVISRLAELLS